MGKMGRSPTYTKASAEEDGQPTLPERGKAGQLPPGIWNTPAMSAVYNSYLTQCCVPRAEGQQPEIKDICTDWRGRDETVSTFRWHPCLSRKPLLKRIFFKSQLYVAVCTYVFIGCECLGPTEVRRELHIPPLELKETVGCRVGPGNPVQALCKSNNHPQKITVGERPHISTTYSSVYWISVCLDRYIVS